MKHLIPITLIALVPAGASLFGANPPAPAGPLHRVKVLKVDYEFERAPRFPAEVDRPRKDDPRLWLRLEAEAEVETHLPNKFIPELTATWRLVVNDAFASGGANRPVQLRAELTYRLIRTHDKTIRFVAFVHPDTLEALTGEATPNQRLIEAAAVEFAGADVTQTEKHRDGLWKSVGTEAGKRWWDSWTHRVTDDAILPLPRTPFFPLWADHYPQVAER